MTTKIAHIADTHLGYRQYGLTEREKDYYETFEKIVDDIIDKDVDYVIHAGDLFESAKPPIKALLVAQECFNKLLEHDIPVYAITGNHDIMLRREAPYPQKLFENENFHIFTYDDNLFDLDEDIALTGLPYYPKRYEEAISEKLEQILQDAQNYKWKILMLHGAIRKYFDFEPEFELNTIPEGFDYYAMGHLHGRIMDNFKNGKLSYSGSTEIRSKDELINYQKNGKGYNLITIDDDNLNVEYVNIPLEREFIVKSIEYPNLKENLEELEKSIISDTSNNAKKPVVDLTIKNGNFDRTEVASLIYEKLEDITLTIHITYQPTEDDDAMPDNVNIDDLTPENMIKEKLSTKINETIAKLGLDLYQNLSAKNKTEAKNVAFDYYKKIYKEDN